MIIITSIQHTRNHMIIGKELTCIYSASKVVDKTNEDEHFAYTHVVNNICIMDIYILFMTIEGISKAHVLA